MTENNSQEQPLHSPHEVAFSTEQPAKERKKTDQSYKKHTHIPLDPREGHFKK